MKNNLDAQMDDAIPKFIDEALKIRIAQLFPHLSTLDQNTLADTVHNYMKADGDSKNFQISLLQLKIADVTDLINIGNMAHDIQIAISGMGIAIMEPDSVKQIFWSTAMILDQGRSQSVTLH